MVDCVVDAVQKIVLITLRGELSGRMLEEVTARLSRQPLGGDFAQLIDLREARCAQVRASEIQLLASVDVQATTRRAIVVSDPLTFGLVRMFQAHREAHGAADRIAVFRDPRSAEAWLLGEMFASATESPGLSVG